MNKKLVLILGLFIQVSCFQNCGPGFRSENGLDSSGFNSGAEPLVMTPPLFELPQSPPGGVNPVDRGPASEESPGGIAPPRSALDTCRPEGHPIYKAFNSSLSCISGYAKGVSTFSSIGLYLAGSAGLAEVRYRQKGAENPWLTALPLWFDERDNEHRGSIVGLAEGTEYEVQIRLNNKLYCLLSKTWNEAFPISSTIDLGTRSGDVNINSGGTESGYVEYRGGTISGGKVGITVNASYVIIRGLTISGPREHGIELGPKAHHVVIDNNVITNWGSPHPETPQFGMGWHSGVFGDKDAPSHHIVIQGNHIHSPRSSANAWSEYNAANGYSSGCQSVPIRCHPEGPQGISLRGKLLGSNIIRKNRITSLNGNVFNDAMGGSDNYSSFGFPGPDSDVYENYVSHYADDGLELEGGGKNVRVWGNRVDGKPVGNKTMTVSALGLSVVHQGPLYAWRNILNRSKPGFYAIKQKTEAGFVNSNNGDLKIYGGGATFFFHNTVVGWNRGIYSIDTGLFNVTTRNNIFDARLPLDFNSLGSNNDFDFDLTSSPINPTQPHGVVAQPKFDENYGLLDDSQGIDQGLFLPGFNDCFRGAAPDLGAVESMN